MDLMVIFTHMQVYLTTTLLTFKLKRNARADVLKKFWDIWTRLTLSTIDDDYTEEMTSLAKQEFAKYGITLDVDPSMPHPFKRVLLANHNDQLVIIAYKKNGSHKRFAIKNTKHWFTLLGPLATELEVLRTIMFYVSHGCQTNLHLSPFEFWNFTVEPNDTTVIEGYSTPVNSARQAGKGYKPDFTCTPREGDTAFTELGIVGTYQTGVAKIASETDGKVLCAANPPYTIYHVLQCLRIAYELVQQYSNLRYTFCFPNWRDLFPEVDTEGHTGIDDPLVVLIRDLVRKFYELGYQIIDASGEHTSRSSVGNKRSFALNFLIFEQTGGVVSRQQ
jgi:hypothetical protein